VLLDVGGVFVVPSPAVLRPVLGVDAGDEVFVRAHYAAVAALDAFGTEGWLAYFASYAHHAGVPVSRMRAVLPALRAAFRADARITWSHIRPESVEGLRALAATEIPVAIVSNSDGTVEKLLRETGICQVGEGAGTCVAVVIDSHVVGVAKPDPSIFSHALDVLGVPADRCLYVGDTVCADVAGARAAGLHPVHLDPYDFCAADDHDHVASVGEVTSLLR
jgi:putative hydrolase of the HAD superfamily